MTTPDDRAPRDLPEERPARRENAGSARRAEDIREPETRLSEPATSTTEPHRRNDPPVAPVCTGGRCVPSARGQTRMKVGRQATTKSPERNPWRTSPP